MKENDKIHNTKELEFAIFCIESVAEKIGIPAEKVYQALTSQSDILNQYIVTEYEILHTQSKEYIVAEIIEEMKEAGVEL